MTLYIEFFPSILFFFNRISRLSVLQSRKASESDYTASHCIASTCETKQQHLPYRKAIAPLSPVTMDPIGKQWEFGLGINQIALFKAAEKRWIFRSYNVKHFGYTRTHIRFAFFPSVNVIG
ncbi:hypothetical protein CDAR_556391 [Caerostris darwini]|uniref:Uncharacterized protein n=1 Tax=Caerostris darwini TaxID=1538125 RepID=A0AAV4SLE1_9ARAC|nr:hypothetical protein CDAR_556391 [Caerostris darwini]